MKAPIWHLHRAKAVLQEWYDQADVFTKLSQTSVFIPKKWRNEQKRLALRCKTEGLLWHDRYKMLLDCHRRYY